MSPDYLIVLAVVAALSVVQSIFGMGILIFGTPTLLLLGHDFVTAIAFLVPASFAVSVLQVVTAGATRVPVSRNLYLLCVPGIGVGLWLIQGSSVGGWVNYIIGAMLLVSAGLRLWRGSQEWLSVGLRRYSAAYHLVMGLTHGLTNLGGALLAILASGLHEDKQAVRYTVAHYYVAFGAIQLILIGTLLDQGMALLQNLPMAAVSVVIYLLVGNRLFLRASGRLYHHGLTAFAVAYGIAVLLTA